MGRQTIEVYVPDGWRAVAYRKISSGDYYLLHGAVVASVFGPEHERCVIPHIIVEPDWTAPPWLKPGTWLAMDSDGTWCAYQNEPYKFGRRWETNGIRCPIICHVFEFTPPPCSDWKTSKRQIGARE